MLEKYLFTISRDEIETGYIVNKLEIVKCDRGRNYTHTRQVSYILESLYHTPQILSQLRSKI